MKIFALSGSLRRSSVNGRILDAFADLASRVALIDRYEALAEIAPFNPDIADEDAPAPVVDLRARVAAADLVLISSPEYAMGPPGVLKNALDWLVGSGELYGKPVILAHPINRAMVAKAALEGTLGIMGADLRTDAFIPVELAEFAEAATGSRPLFTATVQRALGLLAVR